MNYELRSTGIEKLDRNLFESVEDNKPVYGVPKGTIILVKGMGKELLAKQFASVARKYEEILYFATEEGNEEILNILKEYEWNKQNENIEIIDVLQAYNEISNEKFSKANKSKEYYVCEELNDKPDLLLDLYNTLLESIEYGAKYGFTSYRLVIDSLNFYLSYYDNGDVIDIIRLIANKVKNDGAIGLMTLSDDMFSRVIEKQIENIADCILGLKIKEKGEEVEYTLEIEKIRNHPEKCRKMTCYIGNKGIEIQEIGKIG